MNVDAINSTCAGLKKARDKWVIDELKKNPQMVDANGKEITHQWFWFLVYDEDERQMKLLRDLDIQNSWEFIYIHHTQDIEEIIEEDGSITYKPKKPHWHVMIKVKRKCTNSAILKDLAYYMPTIKPMDFVCGDFKACLNYLPHRSITCINEGKHMYDFEELIYSSNLENLVGDFINTYSYASVSPVQGLISTINEIVQTTEDANDVFYKLAMTKYSYMLAGSSFNMVRVFVDNALKSYSPRKRMREAELLIYDRCFDRYLDALLMQAGYSIRYMVYHAFTSSDISNIMTRFVLPATNHKDTIQFITDCILDGYKSRVQKNVNETISLLFDRLEKDTDCFVKRVEFSMPLFASFILSCKTLSPLKDNISNFLRDSNL